MIAVDWLAGLTVDLEGRVTHWRKGPSGKLEPVHQHQFQYADPYVDQCPCGEIEFYG